MSWKELTLVLILVVVELNGNGGNGNAAAFSIDRKSWRYKGHSIAYEECVGVGKREVNVNDNNSFEVREEIPVLVLNGFGVGSFHQHRLMPHLTGGDGDGDGSSCRRVYGVDYLGQGQSWPIDCDDGNSSNDGGWSTPSTREPWGEVVAREVPDSEIALSWTEQLLTRMV
eukprot:CAMPEP_0194396972 /NCGR_PEP_ID=MMETSP0174-20130528/125284_1 /TAXON_ID=216777 /ORGANISM="Proboscia alata, Strain PI-D3" /LENGTH=169 /DNA_ID=CAMNT_0039193095 /DNA_START=97 /DNA_END=607 /DNA_ORIENTATION=+